MSNGGSGSRGRIWSLQPSQGPLQGGGKPWATLGARVPWHHFCICTQEIILLGLPKYKWGISLPILWDI